MFTDASNKRKLDLNLCTRISLRMLAFGSGLITIKIACRPSQCIEKFEEACYVKGVQLYDCNISSDTRLK